MYELRARDAELIASKLLDDSEQRYDFENSDMYRVIHNI